MCTLPAYAQGPPPDVSSALAAWRSDHGNTWEIILDPETHRASTLFNGRAEGAFHPVGDAEQFQLAREFVRQASAIHGIDERTLVADRVHLLPLGQVGLTDKITVRFRQEIGGIPVRGGWVNVLLDTHGGLLSLASEALPGRVDVNPELAVPSALASSFSAFVFEREVGLRPDSVGEPVLAVFQRLVNSKRSGVLVWEVDVSGVDPQGNFHSYRYFIKAVSAPEIVGEESLVHFAFAQENIRGTVKANVTNDPEHEPDDGSNFTLTPLAYIHIRNRIAPGQPILATTNANGRFVLPIGSTNKVRIEFSGPYVDVSAFPQQSFTGACSHPEDPSANLTHDVDLLPGENDVVLTPSYDPQEVAQANVFYYINQMRDWILAVDPGDGTFDGGPIPYVGRPNRRDECDAQLKGACVTFGGQQGGFCPFDLAFSTIVLHEMGHWMNKLYRGINASAFNEGIADVWAMYITDYDVVGNGLFVERWGGNGEGFCGDCVEPTCIGSGSIQENGQPLMGALWKVREQLKGAHGEALGGGIADALFLAWMKAFSTNEIKSVIEYQWLILDDDDGILANGTPNYPSIDTAFRMNAFPGVDLGLPPALDACPDRPCGTVDFATDDFGAPLVNGQDITTPPEFGNVVSISATGIDNFGAAVFDSTPGGPNVAGPDPDLLVGLGNVLILQEDEAQTVPGIFDQPDDAKLGGTMIFDFTDPVELFSVDLIDIDTTPPSQDVTVTLFDDAGLTRVYDVPSGWTGDVFTEGPPGYRSLFLNSLADQAGFQSTASVSETAGFRPVAVVRLEIQFDGSGGVDNLTFCVTP